MDHSVWERGIHYSATYRILGLLSLILQFFICYIKKAFSGGFWLAQMEDHGTVDLRVMSLSPMLDMETIKIK